MRASVARVLFVAVTQALLVWVATTLLTSTDRSGGVPWMGSTNSDERTPDSHTWFYTSGKLIPWAFRRHATQSWPEKIDQWSVDRNIAVPVAACLFALTAPPAVLGWVLQVWAWVRGRERPSPSRVRLLWAAFLAGVGGLVVAWVVAVATGKGSTSKRLLPPIPSRAAVHRMEAELRRAWPSQSDFGHTCDSYTRLTWVGIAAGAVSGLLAFRPWRRSDCPTSPTATPVTTPPA
jgi:hypothetical protein